jgi:hypothetical protein
MGTVCGVHPKPPGFFRVDLIRMAECQWQPCPDAGPTRTLGVMCQLGGLRWELSFVRSRLSALRPMSDYGEPAYADRDTRSMPFQSLGGTKVAEGCAQGYPSTQNPKLNDRLYFVNKKLQLAQSASDDPRYPNRIAIEKAFGNA